MNKKFSTIPRFRLFAAMAVFLIFGLAFIPEYAKAV